MPKISEYPDGGAIQDTDQFVSRRGTANKSNLWSTVKSTLKTYFDTLYAGGGGSNSVCDGRLTLASGSPVPTTDQLAKTTVYFTPYIGNKIALYDGVSAWSVVEFTEKSVAVPATTNTPFDIFAYNNAGTVTLETVNWTNDTTRATALTYQDGVLVKTGATTRRYLGTGRTTGSSGQCEDSAGGIAAGGTEAKRYLWNYYNRKERKVTVGDSTDSWVWDTASYRSADNSATMRAGIVIGVVEDILKITYAGFVYHNSAGVNIRVGIGVDSVTVNGATVFTPNNVGMAVAIYNDYPTAGFHYYQALEKGNGATSTFYGDNGGADQTALYGYVVG